MTCRYSKAGASRGNRHEFHGTRRSPAIRLSVSRSWEAPGECGENAPAAPESLHSIISAVTNYVLVENVLDILRRSTCSFHPEASIVHLILFDIDGTLVSAFGAGVHSVQQAFDEVFGRPDAANRFSPHWFAGRNDMWILREIAMSAGITAGDYEVGYSRLESAYLARLRENLPGWEGARVLPGVRELLDTLVACGASRPEGEIALGIVTGNLEEGARIKLANFGLDGYFTAGGYGSDAVERSEITGLARTRFERRLGRTFEPGEVLVIGDTIHDISAARACGFRVAAVATGTTSAEDLTASGPDLLLRDLSDPGPILDLAGARA